MNYYINPLAFTGIFAVPNSVVDDNIRLASALQLKTLLYMLRHSSEGRISTEELSKAIGYGEEDISDALIFWEERGLVVKDGSAPAAPVTAITEAAPRYHPLLFSRNGKLKKFPLQSLTTSRLPQGFRKARSFVCFLPKHRTFSAKP